MLTVLRIGPYRFFFYSADQNEPRHVSTSPIDTEQAHIIDLRVAGDALTVDLDDGRTLSVPLTWYPRLTHWTPGERNEWRLIGGGTGVHWPRLDEDISVEGLLADRRSGEAPESLRRWLTDRDR